jgi:hypothetical protein
VVLRSRLEVAGLPNTAREAGPLPDWAGVAAVAHCTPGRIYNAGITDAHLLALAASGNPIAGAVLLAQLSALRCIADRARGECDACVGRHPSKPLCDRCLGLGPAIDALDGLELTGKHELEPVV